MLDSNHLFIILLGVLSKFLNHERDVDDDETRLVLFQDPHTRLSRKGAPSALNSGNITILFLSHPRVARGGDGKPKN